MSLCKALDEQIKDEEKAVKDYTKIRIDVAYISRIKDMPSMTPHTKVVIMKKLWDIVNDEKDHKVILTEIKKLAGC